ncbi:hypothetical protein IWW39_006164 [Coemansia spiralis]|uniref:Type 1 phosphatases regulator n=1 Tax=Coemansia spiralis TaxID=417178 RepID=A0A9W8GDU7_9FUNG|nr:hypothetical protein IWW39_006164 [Coemansia spiralis]
MAERAPGAETTTNGSGPSALAGTRLGELRGSGTSLASHGSRTMVVGGNGEGQGSAATSVSAEGVLRLRGESSRQSSASAEEQPQPQPQPQPAAGGRVQWAEDTVDNEHLNRKKSKVCCIFRRQRQFDESDSDESCGSGSSSGGEDSPNEYERMPKARSRKHKHRCQAGGDDVAH